MYTLSAWYSKDGEAKLKPSVKYKKYSGDNWKILNIWLDDKVEFQKIQGFGGTFNEIGWEAASRLDQKQREDLIKDLFDTENGCRFTLCRIPIGANDFALDAYSYNDVRDDFEMDNFSIGRDKELLIPYIKEAKKINPDIFLKACPWSPPYWMKTSDTMCCGGELIDDDRFLKAYAKYFRKYIEAYAEEGLVVDAVCIQNETNVVNIYPTSSMPTELMKKFIRAYLYPAFLNERINTKIIAGTFTHVPEYADEVMNDSVLSKKVWGLGFQYSTGQIISHAYKTWPGKKIYHTESPCHNGDNSWEQALRTSGDIIVCLQNGTVNYCYWNMILNETECSTWDWKQNSMITINRDTKEITLNPDYYVMKHFSCFINPEAVRIGMTSDNEDSFINCVAFKNADGSIVLNVVNFSQNEKTIGLHLGEDSYEVLIEAESISTIRLTQEM